MTRTTGGRSSPRSLGIAVALLLALGIAFGTTDVRGHEDDVVVYRIGPA